VHTCIRAYVHTARHREDTLKIVPDSQSTNILLLIVPSTFSFSRELFYSKNKHDISKNRTFVQIRQKGSQFGPGPKLDKKGLNKSNRKKKKSDPSTMRINRVRNLDKKGLISGNRICNKNCVSPGTCNNYFSKKTCVFARNVQKKFQL